MHGATTARFCANASEAALRTATLAASLMLAFAGCSPSGVRLPTTSIETCSGHAIAAVLRGDKADPDVAWIEGYESHERTDVVWPTGFAARFDPHLEILDPSGRAVLREGDFINGTCGVVSEGRELLAPPFLALKLDCGPLPILKCQLAVGATARANGWPDKEMAEIQFLDSEARYQLVYEDGTMVAGRAPTP